MDNSSPTKTRHVLKERNSLVSSPNRAKNNSYIDTSQVPSENNSLIIKSSDENFLETTADASLLTGFNNLNIATPKSQKSPLLLEPSSNTCPSSDDESFAECNNSFNVTQNDETEVTSTQTVLNDVSSQLNQITEVQSHNCDDYDPLDEIECFSIDRKLLVQNPVNTTHFEDYSYISSSGLPGNSNVDETFDESSLNDFEKTVIEERSCESLKELAVKSVNSLNHKEGSEVTNLVACDSGVAFSETSENFCQENEPLDGKIVVEEPMDVDESIYEVTQEVLSNQTFEEPEKVPGEAELVQISGSLNQTFEEPEKISEIPETVQIVEKTIEPLTEHEKVLDIPEIVPVATNLDQTFEEHQKNSEFVPEISESVPISQKLDQTFEEPIKEQELVPEISDSVPIFEKLNQTFEEQVKEQDLVPEIPNLYKETDFEPESVPISEKLNQTFEEPQKNSEPIEEQELVPEISDSIPISDTLNQTFEDISNSLPEPQNNSETLGSSNQTVIESETVPISEQLSQTFEELEKVPEISSNLNQTFDEPAHQQLNQTFEQPAAFQAEIMPEQQIDQPNERRLSIRSDLFETPQSTPIKERSLSALSQNNNSEVFVEQKLQENLDVTFKTPAIPGGSGFFNMRKSGGVVAAEEEEFNSSNKFTFEHSDFDFLENKRSSDILTDDRNSILLRFDPLLGVPVPVITAAATKLSATIEEETNNSNCFGAGAGVEEQIGDCAMTNVDMKIENMSDIKTSLDDKQDYKMAELDKKMKNEHLKTEEMEKMLKDAEAREEILLKRITEKDKAMTRMCFVVEEYEKAIAELIAEKEQIQQEADRKRDQLRKDADTNGLHLASLEDTFSDLHAKYEKSKQFTISLKDREEILLLENKKARESLVQQEQRYDQMKNHAILQLDHANDKLASMERTHAIDMTRLKANLKKAELSSQSATEQLQQKTRENEELVKICDELIGTPS